jgi:cytochrome c551/c552
MAAKNSNGRFKRASLLLLLPGFVIVLSTRSLEAQLSLKELDTARIPEGNSTSRATAQYLINRENLARDAIQIGRNLFHHDYARDKDSGCNGLPCEQKNPLATRAAPQSLFEASSCDTCHAMPSGSAGFGPKAQDIFAEGNTIRTPDMFGAGLVEELGREASEDLKAAEAGRRRHVTENGVDYDQGLGIGNGGTVNRDLVLKPFGRKGVESHVRAFISRAAFKHLGIQAEDRFQCPAGDNDGDGRCDGPVTPGLDPDNDGIRDELTQGGLSLLEHYLVNYPIPARGPITLEVKAGERIFAAAGCVECHRPEMRIRHDPRIEHVTLFWNDQTGRFEAERRWLYHLIDDGYIDPLRQRPLALVVANRQPFVVPLYADLKRHNMGPRMADVNDEEGVSRSVFITRPLWGIGSYTSFLHDGSATTLEAAILRHGGEAKGSRRKFARMRRLDQRALVKFLKSFLLFSVEDVLNAKIPITRGDVP